VVELTASGIGGVLVPALTAAGLVVLWGIVRERTTGIAPLPDEGSISR
jgi:hypothetical protein